MDTHFWGNLGHAMSREDAVVLRTT